MDARSAFEALYQYVREGGGLVAYHSSFTWGRDIPEYKKLVGAVMQPGTSRRSPPDAFMVELTDRDHPVTKGLRRFHWTFTEDMYTNMVFAPDAKIRVLATAHDDAAAYAPERAGPKYPPDAYTPERADGDEGHQRQPPAGLGAGLWQRPGLFDHARATAQTRWPMTASRPC